MMITGSRGGMTYNPNHLGRMKIAKNRRGEEGIEVPYIRLDNGRFRIITETLFSKLKGITEKRNYTDADINYMLDAERQQNLAAQQSQAGVNMSAGATKPAAQPVNNKGVNPLDQFFKPKQP